MLPSSPSASARLSSSTARRRCGEQARTLLAAVGAGGRVFYGTKAFANVAVLRVLREEVVGADVASSGELAFAETAGLTGADLVVHGNNKDEAFLRGPRMQARPSCSTPPTRRSSRRPPASSACSCA